MMKDKSTGDARTSSHSMLAEDEKAHWQAIWITGCLYSSICKARKRAGTTS